MIKGGIGVNERQVDVIMGIVQENLEDFLSEEMTMEACFGIREGIRENMVLIDQLGAQDRRTERKEGAGKHEAKRGTKMEDGCLVSAREIMRILLVKTGDRRI